MYSINLKGAAVRKQNMTKLVNFLKFKNKANFVDAVNGRKMSELNKCPRICWSTDDVLNQLNNVWIPPRRPIESYVT